MSLQAYGLTGRKRKQDYVGEIEARRPYLAYKKEQADTEAYRNKVLALQSDKIKADEKAATRASVIGLGQLGMSTYFGKKRDDALEEIISGSGKDVVKGAVAPTLSGADPTGTGPGMVPMELGGTAKTPGFMSSLKSGASNWGTIAGSSLSGGAAGGELAARFFGDNTLTRAAGGAVVAGGLGYLASGDPYTAGISALFGGGIASLFG